MKKLLYIFPLLLFVLALCACSLLSGPGQPDRTGSWAHINQDVARNEGWQRIVESSPFQLGERVKAGSWQGEDGEVDYFEAGFGTYPLIDGSTVAVPMGVEFARQHLGLDDEDAKNFVIFNTTDIAYEFLITKASLSGYIASTNTAIKNKPVDIIIVTEPSDDELALAKSHGVQLVVRPVCYDAFVFITHKDNPVDSLTVEQIQKIYSGEITNWNQVGGPDKAVRAFQREPNSGSQTTMEKRVMRGKKMLEPEKIKIVTGMGGLVESVAEYRNDLSSIGYTFKYYIDTLYKNDDIKVLNIEGIAPSQENMRKESYPFTTNYFGVIRAGDEGNTGGKFFDWMLSGEGQRCIAQAGYCPLKNTAD